MSEAAAGVPATRMRAPAGPSLPLIAGFLVFAAALVTPSQLLGDADLYWHIAAGQWMLAHGTVPHADPFSFSMPGAPWVAHEWLGEMAFAALYDQFGWAGPVAATAFAFAVALALLLRALLMVLAPPYAIAGFLSAWLMLLPHVLARPHLLALPFLVAWTAGLVAARADERAPTPALAAVMVLWANLHASFVLGLVLTGLFGGEAIIEAGSRARALDAARRWGGFLALALAASLATPNGIWSLWLPFHLLRMNFALEAIDEWRSPDFHVLQPLEAWILGLLFLGLARGFRMPWPRALILLLLIHLALAHKRDSDLLGALGPLVVAAPAAAALPPINGTTRLWQTIAALAAKATLNGIALVGGIGAALAAFVLLHGIGDLPNRQATPAAALAAVRASHITGPVLNDYWFGGYLIFAGVPVFIDGRTDMYGDAFFRDFVQATAGVTPDLPSMLDRYKIAWTIFLPTSPAVRILDHLPGWRRLYADDVAVVHVRTNE